MMLLFTYQNLASLQPYNLFLQLRTVYKKKEKSVKKQIQ